MNSKIVLVSNHFETAHSHDPSGLAGEFKPLPEPQWRARSIQLSAGRFDVDVTCGRRSADRTGGGLLIVVGAADIVPWVTV
jgi:hypothetical protein